MMTILEGDAMEKLRELPDESVQCCVTSPPYWGLRDYGVAGQIGLEKTPEEYVAKMVAVFGEVKRVLREDGTLWLNLGDSYARSGMGGNPEDSEFRKQATNAGSLIPGRKPPPGLKPKDLCGIPWRVAFALQADGWYLRSDIIWHKPNPMPESVTDRPTKSHEYLFLLAKGKTYYYDAESIKEPGSENPTTKARNCRADAGLVGRHNLYGTPEGQSGNGSYERTPETTRNRRSVWTVPTSSYSEAHFATFPPDLIKPCILAGCPVGGTVLDPFGGSGTTGKVALEFGRKVILIELNPAYVKLIHRRTNVQLPLMVL